MRPSLHTTVPSLQSNVPWLLRARVRYLALPPLMASVAPAAKVRSLLVPARVPPDQLIELVTTNEAVPPRVPELRTRFDRVRLVWLKLAMPPVKLTDCRARVGWLKVTVPLLMLTTGWVAKGPSKVTMPPVNRTLPWPSRWVAKSRV